MRMAYMDLETYSETPISHGVYKYSEQAEVLLWAYALENEEPEVWDVTSGSPMPVELSVLLDDPNIIIVFHNYNFDSTVLEYAMGIKIPTERLWCTMAQALAHGLPGSLQTLCKVMNVPLQDAKQATGKDLVRYFCMPRSKNSKLRRLTRETNPKEWGDFIKYAASDIKAMRTIHRLMPKWNYREREMELWGLDRRISQRGMRIDGDLARSAINAVAAAQGALRDDVSQRTGGAVASASQRDRLLAFILKEYGITFEDMQKSTMEKALNDERLPQEVKDLIAIRLQASMSSTSKYIALMNCVNSDGRLRGTLQYCGASRTGRWAGRNFQPQNLMRNTMPQKEIELAIERIKQGCAHEFYS